MSNINFIAVSNKVATAIRPDSQTYANALLSEVKAGLVAVFTESEVAKCSFGKLTDWGKAEVKALVKGFIAGAKFGLATSSNEEVAAKFLTAWGLLTEGKKVSDLLAKSEIHSQRRLLQLLEEELGVPEELWFKPHTDLDVKR